MLRDQKSFKIVGEVGEIRSAVAALERRLAKAEGLLDAFSKSVTAMLDSLDKKASTDELRTALLTLKAATHRPKKLRFRVDRNKAGVIQGGEFEVKNDQ